jgi:hypothetical protein
MKSTVTFTTAILSLLTLPIFGQRYAGSVTGFSRQYNPAPEAWSAIQVLGSPNVYPEYGDIDGAWTPENYGDQRDYIEVAFDNDGPIDSILVWETDSPGFIDTVYVKNPSNGQWVMVYSTTASAAPLVSRILRIGFPTTSFNVNEIRIAVATDQATDWVEIDAIAIKAATGGATPDNVAGQAIAFDGVAGRYSTNLSFGSVMSATAKTITAWIKPLGTGPSVNSVYDGGGIVSDGIGECGIYQAQVNGGADSIYVYNYGYLAGETYIAIPVSTGSWMHIAMVHGNDTLKAYMDGTLAGAVWSDSTDWLYGTMEFGHNYYSDAYWSGEIDEVHTYDRALSQPEILAGMNVIPAGSEPGLTGMWQFNALDIYNPVSHVKDSAFAVTLVPSTAPVPTGIPETVVPEIRFYPNPSNGSFYVEANRRGAALIEVFASNGQRVLVEEANAMPHAVQLQDVAPGLYMVTVTAAGERTSRMVSVQ